MITVCRPAASKNTITIVVDENLSLNDSSSSSPNSAGGELEASPSK